MPSNLALLRRSLCAAPWLAQRIALYGVGLAEANSSCFIISGHGNRGDGFVVCDRHRAETTQGYSLRGVISLRRLDTLLGPDEDVQVLKIDVEGYEQKVCTAERERDAPGGGGCEPAGGLGRCFLTLGQPNSWVSSRKAVPDTQSAPPRAAETACSLIDATACSTCLSCPTTTCASTCRRLACLCRRWRARARCWRHGACASSWQSATSVRARQCSAHAPNSVRVPHACKEGLRCVCRGLLPS